MTVIKTKTQNTITVLVFACFFLSGTAGLIYEVLWLRMIDKIIGSAPFAVTAILTVFMGGMAIGSWFAGRFIDRAGQRRFVLTVYGLLELTIGIYALFLPYLINGTSPFYRLIYDRLISYPLLYQVATFFGCTALLIIPTTLMGATLPVLSRYCVRELDHLGKQTGLLYGLNTVGAACGTLICGFYLIQRFGLTNTLLLCAALNVSAGLACIGAARFHISPEKDIKISDKPDVSSGPIPKFESGLTNKVRWALFLFAISGFCSMACQVLWTRLIGLLVGPTHFAFTLVVAAFIVGLAAGSMVFGWVADHRKETFPVLVLTQIAAACFAMLTGQILGSSQFFFAKLINAFHGQFSVLLRVQSLVLFALLFIPTFFMGAAFPLVNRMFTRETAQIGKTIGTAYALNTIGAILGSFTAGFILIPLTGIQNGLSVVFLCQFTVAATALIAGSIHDKQPVFRRLIVSLLFLSGIAVAVHFPSWNPALLSRGWYRDFDTLKVRLCRSSWFDALVKGQDILEKQRKDITVVFKGEGAGGFTTVEKEITSTGTVEYAMFNSGKADASSHGDRSTQTLSAHIPMLFHPDAKQVMVLGLASGMTPGEVLNYPVKHLDILEINDQVAHACRRYFGPYNNHCLDDPRTRLLIQDGRNHLALTKTRYDVIVSEPSNPWMAGLANLYTRDFFLLVKSRLTSQGIFAQWIQSYEMDWDTFALLGRTFTSAFPGGVMFKIGPVDYLLLARADGHGLDWDLARTNLDYARKSTRANFTGADFIAHLIVTEDLGSLFADGPIHTDDRPYLEFSAPRHLYDGHLDIERKAASLRKFSARTLDILNRTSGPEAMLDLVAFAASVNAPTFSVLDFKRLSPAEKNRYLTIMRDFCKRESVSTYAMFHDPEPKKVCADIQINRIRKRLQTYGGRAADHYNLAISLIAAGASDEAEKELEATLALDPLHAEGAFALGVLHAEAAKWAEAAASFKWAAELSPGSAKILRYLGITEARRGLWDTAIVNLTAALSLNAMDIDALNERGAIYLRQNKIDDALRDFSQALAVSPQDAESRNSMAMALSKKGDYTQAALHLSFALKFHPDNETLKYNLMVIESKINAGS